MDIDLTPRLHSASPRFAISFDIHVNNINPQAKKATGRVYVDPHGEKLSDGRIKARLIDYGEANKLYG